MASPTIADVNRMLAALRTEHPDSSPAEHVAMLAEEARAVWLTSLTPAEKAGLRWHWPFFARPKQVPPKLLPKGEPWRFWFIRTGRGWGKNRSATQWLIDRVKSGVGRDIALVARTAGDVRGTLVEVGDTSIMKLSPPDFRPEYEPSKRRLTWPNGAIATTFSTDEPDLLRGPQFDTALCDEVSSWYRGSPIGKGSSGNEAFDNLNFGLRLQTRDPETPPQAVVTSTPKPVQLVRWLSAHPKTLLTRGAMYENRLNLAADFVSEVVTSYKGTSLESQEIFGDLLEELEGALWKRAYFKHGPREAFDKIVVGVDPSASANGHEAGIIVVGRLSSRLAIVEKDGTVITGRRAMVLADLSTGGGPRAWAKAAVEAYKSYKANCIVAETNHGCDMVKMVIEQAAGNTLIPVEEVRATQGKKSRAEPVVMLYQQGRIIHDESMDLSGLEDQMCTWSPEISKQNDRIDATVWGIWALMLKHRQLLSSSLPGLNIRQGLKSHDFNF